jgi:hypothetical protein
LPASKLDPTVWAGERSSSEISIFRALDTIFDTTTPAGGVFLQIHAEFVEIIGDGSYDEGYHVVRTANGRQAAAGPRDNRLHDVGSRWRRLPPGDAEHGKRSAKSHASLSAQCLKGTSARASTDMLPCKPFHLAEVVRLVAAILCVSQQVPEDSA